MTSLLQQWVSDQAMQRPDSVALVMNGETVCYAELEEASNRLARVLIAAGCKKADRICFLIPKSTAAIIAMLGILKADCIHVPLDTSSPALRLSRIVASCEPRFILGAAKAGNLLIDLMHQSEIRQSIRIGWMDTGQGESTALKIEFSKDDLQSYSTAPLDYRNDSHDAAHILYTSGSTGMPKGVVITHANVIQFVEWAKGYFGVNSADRFSCHPPLHFDLSGFDIFGAFSVGAQLHLVPADLSLLPAGLAEFIRRAELTQWFSVPSILNYMARFDVVRPNDFPALKRVLWCGEVFPTPALIYWMKRLPEVQFTNLYGPTETTIASSFYTVPACPEGERDVIPIGAPCAGEEMLVLDKELRPKPPGEIGDLYIRGAGLSPGYWRDPDKTNSAFLANPFSSDLRDRLYRTGDLARIDDDGLVYFLGRSDSQIKSRGYRIELGEIESALNALGLIEEGVAVAINTTGFEGTSICCAYVAGPSVQVTPAAIRDALSQALPAYMLPSLWMSFERLPRNVNGKIDRTALREYFQRRQVRNNLTPESPAARRRSPHAGEDGPQVGNERARHHSGKGQELLS